MVEGYASNSRRRFPPSHRSNSLSSRAGNYRQRSGARSTRVTLHGSVVSSGRAAEFAVCATIRNPTDLLCSRHIRSDGASCSLRWVGGRVNGKSVDLIDSGPGESHPITLQGRFDVGSSQAQVIADCGASSNGG